jgi:hypothetical protein
MLTTYKNKVYTWLTWLYRSIWLFPVVLAIPVIIFTCLQISGTSIGTFYTDLYGSAKDPDLIAGSPESIRSDEWLVNTQTTVSQYKAGYPRVNKDVGKGEDVSLNAGVPYKDWSEIFRPQNLVYFVLPLANAFAFQWWIVGYLLIVSCYFFILALMPKRRLLAASLASTLFFSAFVQWWYEYGTLAALYYTLFIATGIIYLPKLKQRYQKFLLLALISYLAVCFALLLYPPFQVGCGLALLAFLAGYFWKSYAAWGKRKTILLISSLALSLLCALIVVGLFIVTRSSVVHALGDTSYPGKRSSPSGGFGVVHFLSSQLGYQFTSVTRAAQYRIHGVGTNQSEASNFLLLSPLLFIPMLVLVYKDWRSKRRQVDHLLITLLACFVVFMLHLFLPAFSPIAKLFLLGEVPTTRLLLGIGLLNMFMLVAFILRGDGKKDSYWFSRNFIVIYSVIILILELCINIHEHRSSGTFIGIYRAVAFALPLPIIVYLLLRRRFLIAALLYLAFSFFISYRVNPLYKGLSVITDNPISKAMVRVNGSSDKLWVADSVVVENLAAANGLHSLTGVYYYPQNSLWSSIPNASYSSYNRYAHITFGFFTSSTANPQLKLAAEDQVRITTGICNPYLQKENVGFVLTGQKLTGTCIAKTVSVRAPTASYYIYTLHW